MAADTAALQERFRYDTPFWAGGVTKDEHGAWRKPGPRDFQGVAKIRNKSGQIVPAIAHDWQLELDTALERQRAEGKPMRALILKARKLGFSTWVCLKFLQRVTQIAHYQAIVVAQDVDTANTIFEMAKLAYVGLPTEDQLGLGFSIRPPELFKRFSSSGPKFISFGEANIERRRAGITGESIFEVDTAGNAEAGRGKTPNAVHLSEVARWTNEQANRKMLAMLEAIAYVPETILVMESTANGLNHFYRRWQTAMAGQLDEGEAYVPIFVPWWRDKACAMPFATPDQRERFVESIGNESRLGEIAEDENMLVAEYAVTPEQLAWRRMKIKEHPDKSVQTFNQENPHSPESAFIGSGQTVLPKRLIAKGIKAASEAEQPVRGTLRVPEGEWKTVRSRAGTIDLPQAVVWDPEVGPDEHELLVWEHPVTEPRDGWPEALSQAERVDGAYVIGVDVAEGEANTFSEGDYHAIQVLDHRTGMQVARHMSRMDLHRLPLWVLHVAIYYNFAYLAPEVNSIGTAVADVLAKDYRYPRLFKRERIDRKTKVREDRIGWRTEEANKGAMEVSFAEALEGDTAAGLRDPITARQMQTYVVDEKGKHGAQPGEYDDLLMAIFIARRMISLLRPPQGRKTPRGRGYEPRDAISGY